MQPRLAHLRHRQIEDRRVQRLRFKRALFGFLLGAAVFGFSAGSAEAAPLVANVEGDQRPLEIVSTTFSAGQTEATVTLRSSFGIFAFNLDLAGAKLRKLTLLVEKQRYCEGLNFWRGNRNEIDLLHTDGVKILQRGEDLAIEIASPAVDALKAAGAGKAQYVNQYR